jgi:hypothetical protein
MSRDCSDDVDVVEVDSVLVGDKEHCSSPFHFPEVRYGAQSS